MNLQPSNVFSEALAKEKAQRGLPRLSEGGPPIHDDLNVGVLGSPVLRTIRPLTGPMV